MAEDLDRYLAALGTIESSNNYAAMGPEVDSGDRAYGRYQVMGANVPVWTKEALGRSMTPEEFLKDREAQDAVAKHRFGQYVRQYGNPYDAASMWFSGRPMQKAGNASDITGTSVPEYINRFANALGERAPAPADRSGIASLDGELAKVQAARDALGERDEAAYEKRSKQRSISAIMDYLRAQEDQGPRTLQRINPIRTIA